MSFVFPPYEMPTLPVAGRSALFPIHRIYCVGRNYADHAREMGSDPSRDPPFFFQKNPGSLVPAGQSVPYPTGTADFQHEVELVVAIGGSGRDLGPDGAAKLVFGYAVGLDMTKRDLQVRQKSLGQPWEIAKAFDHSAPVGAIAEIAAVGAIERSRIRLAVNGVQRQSAAIADLTWSVPELLGKLSHHFALRPGDLVFTGTPAGVGPVRSGDRLEATIDGLPPLTVTVG